MQRRGADCNVRCQEPDEACVHVRPEGRGDNTVLPPSGVDEQDDEHANVKTVVIGGRDLGKKK